MRSLLNMTGKEISEALSTNARPVTTAEANRLKRFAKQKLAERLEHTRFFEGGWKFIQAVLNEADRMLRTHGIEAIRVREKGKGWAECSYCNTGDTYGTTVFWYRGKFWIGCWGTLAERHETV